MEFLGNSPSREAQRGPLPPLFPANPAGRQHGGFRESPPPSAPSLAALGSSHGRCHLPPTLSQPSRGSSRQGWEEGNRRDGSPGCCGASWISSALFPGRDQKREMQSLVSGGVRSSVLGLGSCMDTHSTGNQHLEPIQLLRAKCQRGTPILPAPSQAQEFW